MNDLTKKNSNLSKKDEIEKKEDDENSSLYGKKLHDLYRHSTKLIK